MAYYLKTTMEKKARGFHELARMPEADCRNPFLIYMKNGIILQLGDGTFYDGWVEIGVKEDVFENGRLIPVNRHPERDAIYEIMRIFDSEDFYDNIQRPVPLE